MDAGEFQHGFRYSLLTFGDMDMAMTDPPQVAPPLPGVSVTDMLPPLPAPATMEVMPPPGPALPTPNSAVPSASSVMPPPSSRPFWVSPSGEGETSFNDSGYFSPQTAQFTALQARTLVASSSSQAGTSYSQSPSRVAHSKAGAQVATPRSSWQEDFPNISDSEWDNNFINNFEETLFNFDASDLNNIVDGYLGSPFKSPSNSPFRSPRQNRGTTQGHALSPLNNISAANVMLPDLKKSPVHLDGGSPLKGLFSTPSPIRGFSSATRTSPMTRQRRRILQSPLQKLDGPAHFLDMPPFTSMGNEIEQGDDLGITPLQRTNSLGFTPTESTSSASPTFPYEENSVQGSQPFGLENFMPSNQVVMAPPSIPEMNSGTRPKQHRKVKMESLHNLRSSPVKMEEQFGLQQNPTSRKSPARLSHGRISVTRHSHLVDKLDSKGALRFVRARFREVLDKAVADADKLMEWKQKACSRKRAQPPGSPQAPAPPEAGSMEETSTGVACYTQIHSHHPAAKRRQEILPKPSPDWPQRQPCKIAPKKRKR